MKSISILTPIREQVLFSSDFEATKQLVLETLAAAPIQDKDIKLARVVVQYQIFNLARLQKYVCDMILAKAGLKTL